MKNKLIISIILVIACIFALAMVSSATEYRVATADEFNTAFAQAGDGDTIVITASITTNFDFGKSITYIIEGDYTWSAEGNKDGMCTAGGKDVYIYARGGNATFFPKGAMWWNSYQNEPNKGYENDLSSTTWSFGSLDSSSTVTIDLASVTDRFFYYANESLTMKEFNLLPGTRVCNLTSNKTGVRFITAVTVNMYENVEIFGNKVGDYAGFIYGKNFNMYGGKVYGNVFGCYGFAQADNTYVFGGEVTDNFTVATGNSGVPGALFNSKAGSLNSAFKIYNCKIENNLLKTTDPTRQSFLCGGGGAYVLRSAIGNNYEVADWGADPERVNGAFKTNFDLSTAEADEIQGATNVGFYDYAVIFNESNSKLIAAYLVKGSEIKSTVSGATEVSIPEGVDAWANKINFCQAVSVDTTKSGTYYAAKAHAPSVDDCDCTTALYCDACGIEMLAKRDNHAISVDWTYEKGVFNGGLYTCDCTNDGCTAVDVTENKSPLFYWAGYSAKTFGEYGFGQQYIINTAVLDDYKAYLAGNGTKFSYGVVAAGASSNGKPLEIVNGSVSAKAGAEFITFDNVSYDAFFMNITGMTESDLNASLVCCAYVQIGNEIVYLDNNEALSTVVLKSHNDIVAIINPKEEE